MNHSIIIQKPAAHAQQLFLLYHGAAGNAEDMGVLGERLAEDFPNALIVAVQAPFHAEHTKGAHWFATKGLTIEQQRLELEKAMPLFIGGITRWQEEADLTAAQTALIGFSQGAIMALESTHAKQFLAARIIALSGQLIRLPVPVPEHSTLHLIHGKTDPIIHYSQCITAAEQLIELEADVTADIIPFLGHEITGEVIGLLIERLKGYIPKYYWDEAMKAEPSTHKKSKA